MMKNPKPLGKKAYGSIPHLPGSRLGPGDYHIDEGQAIIATQKKRDRHDVVIVQEKLDGSNVAVAKMNSKIIPLTRAGYVADTSPFEQHYFFASWVRENEERFHRLLKEGERVCGEWLAQAHGTRYNLPHEPFVAFDLMEGVDRLNYNNFAERVSVQGFTVPNLLHMGDPFPVEAMLERIKISGHGALDEVEGGVWRVERRGKVDFLAKYVQHFKQDGRYFSGQTGKPDMWNVDVSRWSDL